MPLLSYAAMGAYHNQIDQLLTDDPFELRADLAFPDNHFVLQSGYCTAQLQSSFE
jgi:hypothetical protein